MRFSRFKTVQSMKTTEVIDGLYTKNEEVDNGLFPIVK